MPHMPRIEVDHQAVRASLSRLAQAVESPQKALYGIGEWLRASSQARFTSQTAPDGTPWLPLQHWYKQGKSKNQDKVLTLNGYLRNTLTFQVEGDAVLVGSNLEYAAIHQFGGTIRPRVKKALAVGGGAVASVTIPARPYLGVSDDDADEIASLISDYLAGALDG